MPAGEPRAARPGYQPDAEDKALIERVSQRVNYSTREASRWALERQMFEAISFFAGIQWIEYNEHTRRFSRQASAWLPMPVTNAIAPRVGRMIASLLRVEPQGRVRPGTNEAADREAAQVAERLIGHFYDVTDEDEHRQLAAAIASITGTVIAEDFFNPRAGRMLRVPRMQEVETPLTEPAAVCPQCGHTEGPEQIALRCPGCETPMGEGTRPRTLPDGRPAMDYQVVPELDEQGQPVVDEYPEGELQSTIRMLFNFYWDPKATRLKQARWCGEATYVDLDWIDENFPEMGPYVSHESGIDAANFYEASLLSLVGPSVQGTAHYGGMQAYQHGAVLRKYQEKPSQRHPHGLQLVVANGVLLYKGGLPIKDQNGIPTGDFTYSEFLYDIVPGRLPGRCPTEDMVPLQRRVNGIDSQVILNRKTLLCPWLLAPKGSGLNPGTVAMRPGATVLYNFIGVGAAPQVVQGTPLPAQVMEERAQALQAMNELAEDALQGSQQVPAGLRSGIALNFLREQLEEMRLPRRKRWALWIRERDRKRLLLAQQHYREPRAVKLMGQGTDYQVRYWKGSDLRGNTDIVIDRGSLEPKSPALKTQMVFDAVEQGLLLLDDPMTRQKLLEELGLLAFETEIGPDRRRAKRENAQLEEGEPVEPTEVDTHEIHLLEHLSRMKDPSFDYLRPEAQEAFRQHIALHHEAMAAAEEAAKAQALKDAATEAIVRQRVGAKPNGGGGGPGVARRARPEPEAAA